MLLLSPYKSCRCSGTTVRQGSLQMLHNAPLLTHRSESRVGQVEKVQLP